MTTYILAFYEMDRVYGGPEEGRWWFDTGQLLRVWGTFKSEERACAVALRSNRLLNTCNGIERMSDRSSTPADAIRSRSTRTSLPNSIPMFAPPRVSRSVHFFLRSTSGNRRFHCWPRGRVSALPRRLRDRFALVGSTSVTSLGACSTSRVSVSGSICALDDAIVDVGTVLFSGAGGSIAFSSDCLGSIAGSRSIASVAIADRSSPPQIDCFRAASPRFFFFTSTTKGRGCRRMECYPGSRVDPLGGSRRPTYIGRVLTSTGAEY